MELKDFLERQKQTPLFDAVVDYARERNISFHTPGHKHGDGIAKEFREFVGSRIFDMDLTLLEEVDSLHDPQGVIKKAQILAAELYGADYTFFLVNGTSVGNQAMILSTCNPGDKILIPRNAHQSVLAGIILSGATPVYMHPKVDELTGLVCNVTPKQVEEVLSAHPDVKAVLITSPTYNGVAADLVKIDSITQRHKKLFLVDEAHGPHFKFHKDLPVSALQAGADMCVQSTHKILSGMTQASMLHARRKLVDILRLKRVLQLLQTTSPSYILMTSLDVARMQMATQGQELLSKTIEISEEARHRINQIDGFYCIGREIIGRDGIYNFDITKLTINVYNLGLTGYQVAAILSKEYGIQVESADLYNVLALVTIGNNKNDIEEFVSALRSIRMRIRNGFLHIKKMLPVLTFPISNEVVMSPREAVFSLTEKIPFKDAIGRISAETVSPYPPGIPILAPGEKINKETYEHIQRLASLGAKIIGQDDKKLQTIKVVCEKRKNESMIDVTYQNSKNI